MSNVALSLSTADGRKLNRRDSRMHGPPNDLEIYYSPFEEVQIDCSTNEREEFEEDEDLTLDEDILTEDQFEKFFLWLKKNAKLRLD